MSFNPSTYELIERLRRTEYDDLDACKAADIIEHLEADLAELKLGSDSVCMNNFQYLKSLANLQAENAALRKEVEQLRMALADTEALELGTAERCKRWRESYKMQEQQLAITQLEAKRLREALEEFVNGAYECLDD